MIKLSTKVRKNILVAISILIMIDVFVLTKYAYSRYLSSIDLNYTTTTGNIICDVEVDTSSTYYENNVAFFYVKVRNYETDSSGNTTITASNVDYVLTISNLDGSNGLYYYTDSAGNTNDDYESTLTTSTYTFDTTKQEEVFKVYVKELSSNEVTVKFNVNVESVQTNMEES